MKQRCLNPNEPRYYDYGGRGIKVCDEWLTFEGFYADMGERPEGTTIDRIDVNGDYEKSNCRWATRVVQDSNRRVTVNLTYKGLTLSAAEWNTKMGFNNNVVSSRIKMGWSVEKTMETPHKPHKKV
jgi:hypothetical protein